MGAHTTGVPTEIHAIDANQGALQPVALATARLTVPIAGPATKPAAPKAVATLLAKSSAGTSMIRTQSSPAGTGVTTPPTVTGGVSPKVPLKTRVIQLLAFGNFSEAQIAAKLDSPAADVMRVVNVVSPPSPVFIQADPQLGRQLGSASPPVYELQPAQYTKVKINDWTYTHIEKRIVIKRARKAFDELELPAGSDERFDMDKKEKEAISTKPSNSPPNTSTPFGAAKGSDPVKAAPARSVKASYSDAVKVAPTEPVKRSPPMGSGLLPSGRKISDLPPITKIKRNPEVETDTKSTASKSTKPLDSPKPSETLGRAIKKAKPAAKTTFGKELEKHRAGKRGTSMPNGKQEGGVASPRPAAKSTLSGKSTTPKTKSGKPSFEERLKSVAHYSDSSSDEEPEEERPVIRKKTKALPPRAPPKAPTPEVVRDKVSPKLIALGLALFGPEAEAEYAAKAAVEAAEEAEAAARAAVEAKAKAEAAAATAAKLTAALKKRPAEDDQSSSSTIAKKAKISPNHALLGLPARPIEDCQIIDTNPLIAEPIARPRNGSYGPSGSNESSAKGSPYGNGSQIMDRSLSSKSLGDRSHSMNRSANTSTQSTLDNRPLSGTTTPSNEFKLRERYYQLHPAYKLLADQLADVVNASSDSSYIPKFSFKEEEIKEMAERFQKYHAEMESIQAHFGPRTP